jgi:hypothetical protein
MVAEPPPARLCNRYGRSATFSAQVLHFGNMAKFSRAASSLSLRFYIGEDDVSLTFL